MVVIAITQAGLVAGKVGFGLTWQLIGASGRHTTGVPEHRGRRCAVGKQRPEQSLSRRGLGATARPNVKRDDLTGFGVAGTKARALETIMSAPPSTAALETLRLGLRADTCDLARTWQLT
jgi:hypothetical protein